MKYAPVFSRSRAFARFAPLGVLVLAACPGDDNANPDTLWMAPDKSETQVKLVDAEPNPY